MKRLILFRHAKTEPGLASGDDFDRALTERGHRDAALIGHALAGAGLIPDRVLVSAARRSLQTWTAAEPFLPDAHVEVRRDLYGAAAEVLQAAAESAEGTVVMVVAHNPGIQALALEYGERAILIEARLKLRLAEGVPSGAAAAFEIEPGRIGCLGFFTPRDHGGGGAPGA